MVKEFSGHDIYSWSFLQESSWESLNYGFNLFSVIGTIRVFHFFLCQLRQVVFLWECVYLI